MSAKINHLCITPMEYDAILAGLRSLQKLQDGKVVEFAEVEEIHTNSSAHGGLTAGQIDTLIEDMQCGVATTASAARARACNQQGGL